MALNRISRTRPCAVRNSPISVITAASNIRKLYKCFLAIREVGSPLYAKARFFLEKYVSHLLGKRLASFMSSTRKDAGVTQAELARRLSRPQPMISHIERGERRVDMLEFCEIAWALGLKPEDLFQRFTNEVLVSFEREALSEPE